MMKFLYVTRLDGMALSIRNGLLQLEWYVDAAFGVHTDYKGHTNGIWKCKGGKGTTIQKSLKQKLNTSSSTTCELIGADGMLPKILWVPLFLEEQGYKGNSNVFIQDNQSVILLEKNGKWCFVERMQELNIRFFVITDHIEKGDLSVQHFPTEK